jgi:O-acetylhomoserine/O-acetylserine sulfhydrylase-like pyridoxal-dependent enzyme
VGAPQAHHRGDTAGVTALLRLSIDIKDASGLIADLKQALEN